MRESRKIARGSLILFPEATRWTKTRRIISAVIYLVSRFFPTRYTSIFQLVSNLGKCFKGYSFTSVRGSRIMQPNQFHLTTELLFPHDG